MMVDSKRRANLEIRKDYLDRGWTLRANINPAYIRLLQRNGKEYGQRVAQAIRCGDSQRADKLLQDARECRTHVHIRESAAHHDKFLHDALGMPIAVWDREDGKLHSLAYED